MCDIFVLSMKNILFVCTGNTCRSPMALGLVQKALGKVKDIKLQSAGIIATRGMPASPNAIKALEEEDIDISRHETQYLTKELIEKSEIIFVMTQWHKLEVIGMLDRPGKQIYLVKEFMHGSRDDLDLSDPIGKPLGVYRQCRDEIKACIPGMLKKILEK